MASLLFDADDRELLELMNPVLAGQRSYKTLRNLFDPYLHPRGIKELAAPASLRIACAVFDLLGTLESGHPEERLRALRAVREEVLHNGAPSLRNNTARVLLQTMKDLIRAHSDERRQLELAHDFKTALSGRPRLIRRLLRRYHLLEMPEAWNQMAFDHHVHDANSKGRKTPTHLIMDAWLKGIRHLGVIYYNYLTPAAAAELLEAAEIMDVHLRVGVELPARFRGRLIPIIWAPRGFHSRKDFVEFLEQPETRSFMEQGHAVAEHQKRYLLALLAAWNSKHLPALCSELGLAAPPLDEVAFLEYVGPGQTSLLHLAEHAHTALLPHLRTRTAELQARRGEVSGEERDGLEKQLAAMNALVPEAIAERFLRPEANPELPDPRLASEDPSLPELLRLDLRQLLEKLERAPRGNRTILNPTELAPEDVVELLYDGEGKITHLEIFNLKDWAGGVTTHRLICRIRQVVNSGNVVEAKRLLLEILHDVEAGTRPDREQRAEKLRAILRDLSRFLGFYRHSHLKSRLGSDSTGRSRHSHGMGLVVVPSLPRRARRRAHRERGRMLPVHTIACRQVTYTPRTSPSPRLNWLFHALRWIPLLRVLGFRRREEWVPEDYSSTIVGERAGNIAALGGVPEETDNGLLAGPTPTQNGHRLRWSNLSTPLSCSLRVLIGFLPASLTFYLTKEWWVLAYLGAPIWFTITGLRNIGQAVLGGGGLIRSPLLTWRDYVSFNRIADSLLFTGFSVPLLDYLVKTLLLDRSFGVTTQTNPLLLYTVMAVANGTYLCSHNLFRGLQPAVAVANIFRSVLSIPLAFAINAAIAKLAVSRGAAPEAVNAALQLWAAIISKASSDCAAAVIEGLADRAQNLQRRAIDIRDKLDHLFEVYGRLEVMFPEANVLELLEQPKQLVHRLREEAEDLVRQVTVNALDLLYLWMYQPRGRAVLRHYLAEAKPTERMIVIRSQRVLERKRFVSELLISGLVGKRFEAALAFYLSRVDGYLRDLGKIGARYK